MSNEVNNNATEAVEEVKDTAVEEIKDAAAEVEADKKAEKKAKKSEPKKENFFKRMWKKFVKLCKDTYGEMKKVVWTPKSELAKSTKLVLVTVIAISAVIAIIDLVFAYAINSLAGLIG